MPYWDAISRIWPSILSRLGAFAKFILKAIAFACVFIPILLILFHQLLIDAIYKNVDDLNDGEMPSTIASYPSGPEVVGIIGGSGEGLNCSLPWGLDVFFDGHADPKTGIRHLVRQRFRQACVFHDLCYRHGLATYGYSQNDCDRILQNQAFRLCQYIRNKSSKRCQSDSKMILAGVNLGGFGSYRGWNDSTYFEFDSEPTRSNGFSASRVVNHPFKSVDPVKYGDDALQIILTFANQHSNLTVNCATCTDKSILEWTTDPKEISPELKSIGLVTLPEALLKRSLSLSATNPIWLPPRRFHAAPHLIVDGTGNHRLIWLSRSNLENTVSCIVLTNAAELLTYTLPKQDLCNVGAGSELTMVQADMFASSPLPMVLPGASRPNDLVATGLTPQRDVDHSLSLCLWSEYMRATGINVGNDRAACSRLGDPKIDAGRGLGAFQNFAVVRPGQQIFFARDVELPRASNPLTELVEHIEGNPYSTRGSLVVVEITAPTKKADGPGVVAIKKISPFAIDDRFDPMMPITRANNDLRFLSLLATDNSVGVHMIDFAKDNPATREIGLAVDGAGLNLDRSWAERPVLIVEPKEAVAKTTLVFSRGHIIPRSADQKKIDTVRLEVLVLDRNASDPVETPFSVSAGTACTVTYKFNQDEDRACARGFEPSRPMRASPAARMKASQLLVGRFFAGSDGLALAFADNCLNQHPIVLVPGSSPKHDFVVTPQTAIHLGVNREVFCVPLDVSGISQPMPD